MNDIKIALFWAHDLLIHTDAAASITMATSGDPCSARELLLIIWFKVQQTLSLREVYYFIFHFILSNIQSVKQKLIYLLKHKQSAN